MSLPPENLQLLPKVDIGQLPHSPELVQLPEILLTREVRELLPEDLGAVEAIMTANIVGSSGGRLPPEYEAEEVKMYIEKMQETLAKKEERERKYMVATEGGKVVGILGAIFDSIKVRAGVEGRLSSFNGGWITNQQRKILEAIPYEKPFTELINFYVSREHQGYGIGSKLWKEMENWLIENGLSEFFLSSRYLWQDSGAWHIYEKNGYVVYGVDTYRSTPALLFHKENLNKKN